MTSTWNALPRGRRILGRGRLLALSSLALAVTSALPGRADANTYIVTSQAELLNAIQTINADADSGATIQLGASFALTTNSNAIFPTITVPVTLDAQGFTLSGLSPSGPITFTSLAGTLTIEGTLVGGDGGTTGSGGTGLGLHSASLTSSVINNGSIIGGAGGSTSGAGSVAVYMSQTTFINNGTILGGLGTASSAGGAGASLYYGSTLTNNGQIYGGDSVSGVAGVGVLLSGLTSAGSALINNGTIAGGNSDGGTAAGGSGVSTSGTLQSASITNMGTIQGGAGAAGISGNAATTIINSGLIEAGAGYANAISMTGTAANGLTLQLQAGSIIDGNVVASAAATANIFQLGGTANASFDVSQIGAQYLNFTAFQKIGSSTWSLIDTGTAATPWDIEQGTLQIGDGGTSGSIVGDVTDNSALAFDRSDAFAFANLISGTGSVSQVGTGVTTLTGSNTYTGGTTIAAGTLRVSSDASLGDASGSLTFTGGTLNTTADVTSSRNVILDGTGTFSTDAGSTLTLDGTVSGTGSLAKTGDGTLVLTGTNTYVGGTLFADGQVNVSSDANLGAASGSLGFVGGTLHTTADITMNRAVNLEGDGSFLTDAATTLTQAGVIAGSGALVKAGSGTLVLTGDNSYSGGTSINAGTLQVGGGGISGSIVGNVANNGSLILDRSDSLMLAGAISGTGTLNQIGSGTAVLTGTNTYTGGTTISGGALQLGNGGTSGSLLGDVTNNGTLVFDRSDDVTFANVISGSGGVVQAGSGATVLDGVQTYTGTTTIDAGSLFVDGSINSSVMVNTAGTLGGTGTIVGNVTNAGTVAPGDNGIGTLTVSGNYIGQGGTLAINAKLGDDSSATSLLVVTGDTSGTTNVQVTNLGGAGAQTVQGIKVIDVQGASNGSFSLLGNYVYQGQRAVVAGAYAYRLYKNGVDTPTDGDWYLRSDAITTSNNTAPPSTVSPTSPLYAPSVPLYEAYAGVLQRLNQLGTLQQREGSFDSAADDAASADDARRGAAWVHVSTDHADLSPETSTTDAGYDVTTQKLQVGIDGLLHEGSNGVLVAGLTAQSGKATSDVQSTFGEGRIKTTGYGVGGTLTWYSTGGFYVDGQAQWNRYRTDIDSYTLARELVDGNHGSGYSLGIEAGQKFAMNDEWSLIPQGQLIYSSVRFDGFDDPYDATVSRQDGDSLTARAGLAVDHESTWRNDAGATSRAHVYGIANLYYDFMDGTKTDVSGLTLSSRNAPLWSGLGVGGSLGWKDGRYRLFGEALAQTSVQHFGDSSSYSLRVGFDMRW